MEEDKERILVTAALPYANGPLHVGHAIGAYIPADVYTRYHRLKGNDVIYICGTDEHGTPIALTAEAEGISPKEVVDKYYQIISEAFANLGISFDNFSRTTKDVHYKTSQDFFLKILKKGLIYKNTVRRFYCQKCQRFLPDRYVHGTCPYCESEDERGDQCETCGKQFDATELKNPHCAICGEKPQEKETEHFFFKLSQFSQQLKNWIQKNKHWPPNAKNFSLGWIAEGLDDRAITRDLSWGIPIPVEGTEGKVLYVWFEAPIGYISSTKEWAEKNKKPKEWKKYWLSKEGQGTKIVHFIGKDNIPFHAIIWPAILLAHSDFNLPWQISSNEYLNLEGQKMSTSKGWVLWLHEVLGNFEPDLLRYYLLSINPEKHDSDFSLKDFQSRVNEELISTLGNFINRTLTFIKQKNAGKIPKPGNYDSLDKEISSVIEKYPQKISQAIENFKFLQALNLLMEMAHQGNKYFQKKEPWKKENPTTLYLCANLVRSLSISMQPFLPFSAEKTWKMLDLEGSAEKQSWNSASELKIKPEHNIGKVLPLYQKIEDDKIKDFESKFLGKGKMEQKKVTFSDFEKLNLRVGKIKEVKEHPEASKLYILKVDLGTLGERTLVAGIKEFYSKEELMGKNIVVLENLEPREIKGVKSEGMLLAADENGKPILLTLDQEAKSGSKVR